MLSAALTACGDAEQERGEQASTRAPQSSPDAPPAASDGEVPQRLSTNFALLRTPPDGIPSDVRRTLKVPVPGMDWSLARRIPLSLPGTYWLAPGPEYLCIVATTPESPAVGTVCAKAEQALRHGIANTSLDPSSRTRLIVGVVPNGTRTVIVHSGTSTASVRARNGSFTLRDSVPSPPDQLTLR